MSETATSTGVILVGRCPICNEDRYQSKFPFTKPEDAKAANFKPVGDAPDARGEAPPICHVCNSMLSFSKWEGEGQEQETRKPRRVVPIERPTTETRTVQPRLKVNTIFEVQDGENILDVRGQFVITNKRIVEIS
jgi:hypothetical protein